jgi:hypothetical protein
VPFLAQVSRPVADVLLGIEFSKQRDERSDFVSVASCLAATVKKSAQTQKRNVLLSVQRNISCGATVHFHVQLLEAFLNQEILRLRSE